MKINMNLATLSILFGCVSAFTIPSTRPATISARTTLSLLREEGDLLEDFDRELDYSPGTAKTAFAKRFGTLSGTQVKTVGEAFAEFNEILGHPINAIYRSMITDIVGSTHLISMDARFNRDPIWSLGIISALELLLKNYPEQDIAAEVIAAIFKCLGMEEAVVRADAKTITDWAQGKTQAEVTAELTGEGDSIVAKLAKEIKDDSYWMNSRYFAIGLVQVMEIVGVEQSMESAYEAMETWVGKSLGKRHYTACSDSDLYFRTKQKLDMMETLMKEIEIREKKRMADRLEDKAEAALRRAEQDDLMKAEVAKDAENAKKSSSS